METVEIDAIIEAVPKLTCRKCGKPKHPSLFQLSQQSLRWPMCRICKNRPRGAVK